MQMTPSKRKTSSQQLANTGECEYVTAKTKLPALPMPSLAYPSLCYLGSGKPALLGIQSVYLPWTLVPTFIDSPGRRLRLTDRHRLTVSVQHAPSVKHGVKLAKAIMSQKLGIPICSFPLIKYE